MKNETGRTSDSGADRRSAGKSLGLDGHTSSGLDHAPTARRRLFSPEPGTPVQRYEVIGTSPATPTEKTAVRGIWTVDQPTERTETMGVSTVKPRTETGQRPDAFTGFFRRENQRSR